MNVRAECGMILSAAAFLWSLTASAERSGSDADDFWYDQGRASYPGATAPAVVEAVMSAVPQISGEAVFDSGVGDEFGFVMDAHFTSRPIGYSVIIR